jgi:hypothetical protein
MSSKVRGFDGMFFGVYDIKTGVNKNGVNMSQDLDILLRGYRVSLEVSLSFLASSAQHARWRTVWACLGKETGVTRGVRFLITITLKLSRLFLYYYPSVSCVS